MSEYKIPKDGLFKRVLEVRSVGRRETQKIVDDIVIRPIDTTAIEEFQRVFKEYQAQLVKAMNAVTAEFQKMADIIAGPPRRELRDPALRWANTPREFLAQLRDTFLHEFWCAAGQPERSPGWETVRTGGLTMVFADLNKALKNSENEGYEQRRFL